MSSVFSGDETAPFFGFLGAAAALVFSCKQQPHLSRALHFLINQISLSPSPLDPSTPAA
uniref:Uncharacterized protein n=1 Tax=Arundo donax TaxID=35708 RepID=A0A0A9DG67_ARUDO